MRRRPETDRGSPLLRALDRSLGIPLVFALGLLRRKPQELPKRIATIGVLKTAGIGDTTLLSAVLLDLRAAYPAASITLFVGASNLSVARLLAGVDEVVELPMKSVFTARRLVRRHQFDLFLDYGPWPRINSLISYFAYASYKVGFNTPNQYRHYVYDRAVSHSDAQHELENFRDLLRAINVPATYAPGLPPAIGRDEPPHQYCVRGEYVVFHLWPGGYRSYLKEWQVERWLQLGGSLSSLGLRIVLTGATSERDRNDEVVARAARELGDGSWKNVAGASLAQTIAILRRSQLTVSVNTGVMHLAAVLGIPVIGLHGPTSAARWGPVGPRAIAISAAGRDCGYLNLGFEYPRQCTCMARITVEQVLSRCRTLLQDRIPPRASAES